jgi:transcription elongation GreA/GreB family factor
MNLKRSFVEELKLHYQQLISGAHQAETRDGHEADQIRGEARSRDDAKGAVELGRRSRAHRERRERARGELETLIAFASRGLPPMGRLSAVSLGALVDVSIESDEGSEERTLFVLPVGAGTELAGPGGDGFVQVVTPASPLGRALQGAKVGDTVEIVVGGQDREWTVEDIA